MIRHTLHILHSLSTSLRLGFAVAVLGLLCGCQIEPPTAELPTHQEPVSETEEEWEARPTTELSFTAGLAAPAIASRVDYEDDTHNGLHLSWQADETLGVYIRRADGSIRHAGVIQGSGTAGDATRDFHGEVKQKRSTETYLYLYPNMGSVQEMQLVRQQGYICDETNREYGLQHLRSYMPLVWKDGNKTCQKQGYVICLKMTFGENPGAIRQVNLRTMDMGDEGTMHDNIFPQSYQVANMYASVNQSLESKTPSLGLSANLTNQLSLIVESIGGKNLAKNNGDGTYYAEAYLVSGAVENLDVFRTKYRVEVIAQNGTFHSEYRSLPGQESATASTGLSMLTNNQMYTLTAPMSKGATPTIISNTYHVYSLLGMWNNFGKSYDPDGLIVYAGGDAALPATGLPTQLATNKGAIITRYKDNGDGTPTFLGPVSGSLYATNAAAISDTKQSNVTINNIDITAETEVFVTFISEYGWNENLLGYYHYPTAGPTPTSLSARKTLLFPNVSKPNHQPFNLGGSGSGSNTTPANIGTPEQAPLREYETVKLLYTNPTTGITSSHFPAGTTIGFMMMIDTEANENSPKSGYDLLKWSQWKLFTNTAWNAENSGWSTGYANDNFFASGDVGSDASGTLIPGLAIYGVKDNATNTANTAYGAMIFMVSTSEPSAMHTHNKAYFNIGTGATVIAHP
ncbi:MAG: hypothetical protein MJZ89_06075 [Paludibacteraceae bacterium]|nr:hypothetical protein [Paludibacteraceae bacterium]